ncbi:MAG TPA: polysaccharide deacetylase family protein [Anaeromyxobacter sp.]
MGGKKLFLAKVLWRSRILTALRTLREPSLVVLNFHRVRGDGPAQVSVFEEGVFGPSASGFERQMEWVSRNTEVLTEGEVIERFDGGRAFGTPSSLVTFDDGYIDNYETAFPILRRFGIPAIFFIPTALISSRQLGWWDIVAYLVKGSRRSSIRIGDAEISLADRTKAIRELIARVKQRSVEAPAYSMEKLAEACDVPLPPVGVQGRELMTWEQLREVSRSGIAVGSHTHTHPVLSKLGRDGQREELRVSKEILERELGKPVRSIAYPFGGSLHYGKDSMSLASECGYEIGFSFHGRANRSGRIDRFGISRFRAPDEIELMAASIVIPEVFG